MTPIKTVRFRRNAGCSALLAALALLGLSLAGCLPGDDAQKHQQASAPAGQVSQGTPGTLSPTPAAPPRGAPGGAQVLQRLQESNADRGNAAADASAVASGQPPQTVSSRLAAQALDQPSESLRRRAVETIALQRSDDATDLLLTTATDPAPAVRRNSIEALWISAKDMPERIPEIESALREAAADSAPGVAEVAQRALADLQRQRQRSTALPAPVYDPNLPASLTGKE